MEYASRSKVLFLAIALLLVGLFAARIARADELYGRVRGSVTDPSGALVSGAKLRITNVNTGISAETTSGADGSYSFINLKPGIYTLTGSKAGFKSFEVRSVSVIQNQIFLQNIPLELGTLSETLEVQANPVQVESTSMQLGATLSGDTITNLPLNGRNWITLQQTLPGVVASESRFTTNYSTNGSQAQQNSFLVNGTDTNDLPLNSPLVTPSPDAIGEVQLITNTINPEYGRNSGAILNAVTKSGTNAVHGGAFEFYRDTSLNSVNYFTRAPSVFHQHQFGGTLGGPIWKDHSFFFFSYQGARFAQAQSGGNVKVYTNAERTGDFSADAATAGGCPFGTKTSPFPLQNSNGVTQPAGTPWCMLFPTGVIPAADFNPISKQLLTFVPAANSGSFYKFSPVQVGLNDQTLVRVDHTITSKDSVWGTWLWQRAPQHRTLPFTGANLPGFGDQQQSTINQATLAWNRSFGSSTLNELRFGVTRFNFVAVQPQKVLLPSSIGFTGINPQDAAGASVPRIAVRGLFTLGFSNNGPQPRVDTTYQLTDNFSKAVGKHSLKMGFEGRSFMVANPFFGNNNGNFGFNSTSQFSTKLGGADFLLGIPATYAQGSGGHIAATAKEYYAYIQDQWRVANNLTLTLGTGYQVDTPIAQNFNNGVSTNCFVPNQQSTVFPTAPSGLNFPGDKNCNKQSGLSTKYWHFGPRIGFAYSPDRGGMFTGGPGKFSVRGGFGMYYNRHEEELLLQFLGAVPFSQNSAGASDLGGSPSFADPFTDIANRAGLSEANKFPFTPPKPGNASVDFTQFNPLSINVLDPKFDVPYSYNYNLTVQRELPGKAILGVGYVGSMARKLITSTEGNPITAAGQAACIADATCNPALGGTGYLFQHAIYPNHSVYPGDTFASLGTEGTRANSSYNSLQVTLNKATTHGLSFFATYTWSHSIDEGSSYEDLSFSGIRGNNPIAALDRGDSAFDARHRFVLTYNYEFPTLHSNGFLNRIANGWRIGGITTYQTGFPITLGDSGFTSLTCDAFVYYSCWDRPQQVAPLQILDPHKLLSFDGGASGHYYFNPDSFAPAAFGTFGNVRRNTFHGPGISNTDAVVAKETKFTERVGLELRFEFFNVFNHTQFLLPDPLGSNGIQDVQNGGGGIFGQTLSARAPRIIQLGAKISF
jgi:hypothetical protein